MAGYTCGLGTSGILTLCLIATGLRNYSKSALQSSNPDPIPTHYF